MDEPRAASLEVNSLGLALGLKERWVCKALAIRVTSSRRIPSSKSLFGSNRTIPTKVVFIAKMPSVNVETDSVNFATLK